MPSFGYLSRGKLRFFAVFLNFLPSYLGSAEKGFRGVWGVGFFREKVPEFSPCSLPALVFFD
ncbi:MAG: hypothetical protein BEV12_07335 [Microcystis aeruginosa CACIAM 03]|jgi:hypothetical protein|uniref:Uncharacterized protein n=1 Tax=Microcystis aeruginosa PCC 7806SL TaxID=1903187 RepID=A0AB33BH74_MICA7|nr:hypothetical protein BH695_0963 [Microcystis aeruginosa PCC 7806SL]ELS48279.1 hypothetical protein C789_1920 [Microcystis aeruginosa FACHB-905 = DIANCHI905]OCY12994.1 MAG: hypothetical protein BEV12_07335 [Microcystis aeruginosa CACIAM 03]